MSNIEWKCPKCGATANSCGKEIDDPLCGGSSCTGFICECDTDTDDEHGNHWTNPCPNANCYHCGWGGSFPKKPGKMPPWAKKALEAGWKPPEGWQP